MGYPPMIGNEHFHRGYSLMPQKSKSLISYGIIRELGLVIALILLIFVEVPVRIEIAIDVKRPKFEDGFAALQSPPGASNLHAILDQVTASAFDHPRGNRISLGQVVRIVEIRRVIGQIGGTLLKRFALFRAQSLQGLIET